MAGIKMQIRAGSAIGSETETGTETVIRIGRRIENGKGIVKGEGRRVMTGGIGIRTVGGTEARRDVRRRMKKQVLMEKKRKINLNRMVHL